MQRITKDKIKQEYEEISSEVSVEGNVRIVEPYEFKYKLYCKQRWVGKTVIEVFKKEFLMLSEEYVLNAIREEYCFK